MSESIVKEILLTGKTFSAKQALKYNLINFVTNSSEIHQNVREFALSLCNGSSGNSLMITKQLITQTVNPHLEKSLEIAVQINARVRESEDFKKGFLHF